MTFLLPSPNVIRAAELIPAAWLYFPKKEHINGEETLLAAAVAVGAIGAVAAPDTASALALNQWYGGSFISPPTSSARAGGAQVYLGTNGPIIGAPWFGNALVTTATPWTFVLGTYGGTLTVTDVERAGDMFQMYDNGVLMTPALSPFPVFAGQNPGQAARAGGLTSLSNPNGDESRVPEPSTWAMMLLGFAGLGFAGYRKAKAAISVA